MDLNAAGVVRDGSRIAHYGDPGAESRAALGGDAVFDLQHLGLIAVEGEDGEEFLQGQLTSDVNEVTARHAQSSAWCSPKGRVLSCFLVFRHAERLLLQLPSTLLEQTLKRMRMYVLRARATLEDASATWMRMGVVGENAARCLSDRLGALPEQPDDVCAFDGVTVIRLRGMRARFEVVAAQDSLGALWNACRKVATAAGADAWELLDIESGIANIGPATSDAFVPQMLNLDRIGAVSFTKGCYVGQEIVARTQHLGRIKRRMYRARCNGTSPIGPGDRLEAAAQADALKAHVVDAGAAPDGGFDLLAVISIDIAESVPEDGVALGDGSRLTLEALPYALDDETA
jgi:folate-binding protein YgfZ